LASEGLSSASRHAAARRSTGCWLTLALIAAVAFAPAFAA
jgi:hypothetical protein